jgi:predicted TIM-barrel fold metal-dependent hydrolase
MPRIIDSDGHIMDQQYTEEIASYMPSGLGRTGIFPAFDHLHGRFIGPAIVERNNARRRVGAEEWVQFLDDTEIDWTVIYPSGGLGVGRIASEAYAIAACRAYNNWMHDSFVSKSPRLKAVGLIPIQDPEEATEELGRCVNELGMVGCMLPANGEGMRSHLGGKMYWPIYEEAEKLSCTLAVHGGAFGNIGLDNFSSYYVVHALGHPFTIMIQCAAMIGHGIFDRFPGLKVGYLESGAAWTVFFLDRLDRSWNKAHFQNDLEGDPMIGPQPGEKGSEHFIRHVREGRIFIGFDVDDQGLAAAIDRLGPEPFLYASDFPHEGHTAELCRGEIHELLVREDITDGDKQAVLADNADRFYPLARSGR